ncbi:TetR/AcrR family transcriptional regulator [Novosphingobium sp. KCTC 2891]|uniref:TetR/AcrR family transcriptional regulator n=1 Tax=Novosphingobium sp. KCTC 2891 TaxID=2989730 RepID=UPI0022235537|nr:TetR/AcrR family transcriptional regulator [Novosphingobium sp. KCTC 2891]MCW1384061.1 TetR/AcrR family transcriptional regulator [Novosphingobium sp. KCTC 2891]
MALPLTDEQVNDVRQRIREVAEKHIARDGPSGASMRAIATEMGWTAASLYRYYASKADLLAATRTAAYDRFSDCIEAAGQGAGDLWERSRAIGDAYADFAFREPAAYQLIFAFEQDEAESSPELRRAQARSGFLLTSYVREMVAQGLLEGNADQIAHAYWAALHGLVVLRMAGRIKDAQTFDELRLGAARLITRGARPQK